jgi:type IV secretory pathway TraG/TraD family ATPase VirD4
MSWREKFSNLDFGLKVFGIVAIVCIAISAGVFSHGSAEVWRVIEARWFINAGLPNTPLASQIKNTPAIEVAQNARPEVWAAATRTIWLSPVVGIAAATVFVLIFNIRGGGVSGKSKDKLVRGGRVVPAWQLRIRLEYERVMSRTKALPVRIGGLPVPRGHEPLHFLIAGETGTGKSQLILSFLDAIRARGERAIVTDIGGDLMSVCIARGDRLLNIFDERSAKWSPHAELRESADARAMAGAIIQPKDGEAGEWRGYAQSLLSVILKKQKATLANPTNADLFHALATATADELAVLAQGTTAARVFEPGADRAKASVLFTLGLLSEAFEYLDQNAGAKSFSIRRWVENVNERGWLWIPYAENRAKLMQPFLATWVDTAVTATLSLPQDRERRIWLVMDELASLGCIPALEAAVTKGRKFGLVVVSGVQNVAQVRKHYGHESAETILGNHRNFISFSVDGAGSGGRYMCERFGWAEIERTEESRGEQGTTVSTRHDSNHQIVHRGELQTLKNLTAFVKLAGDYPVARIKLRYLARPSRVKPFVPRKDFAPAPVNATPENVDPLRHLLI